MVSLGRHKLAEAFSVEPRQGNIAGPDAVVGASSHVSRCEGMKGRRAFLYAEHASRS